MTPPLGACAYTARGVQIGGTKQVSEPDCQCSLWTTQPDLLASQCVPRGFCGHSDVCGQPGHARHFPRSSPITGTWCEGHYRRLLWLLPMGQCGRRVYLFAIIGVLAALTLWQT